MKTIIPRQEPPVTSCEIGIIYPEGCEGEVMPYAQAIDQFRVYARMREKVRLWTARGGWRESTDIPRPSDWQNHYQERFAEYLACCAQCARVADVLGTEKVAVVDTDGFSELAIEGGEWVLSPGVYVRGKFTWSAWRGETQLCEEAPLWTACVIVGSEMEARRIMRKFTEEYEA